MGRTLDADKERKQHEEEDVSPYAGLDVNDAYDLALYMAQDSNTRGVLIVHMNLQFLFKKGKAKDGSRLTWTEDEKKKYVKDFLRAIWDVWTEAFTIRTDARTLQLKEIVVQFEFNTQIDGSWTSDHWELEITKVDKRKTSSVDEDWGNATLDSEDPYYTFKPNQRAAAHEYGHMMGLQDEYVDDEGEPEQNPHWTEDEDSIMNLNETPRPRHFTPFAHWLTEQYKDLGDLAGEKIVFYVDDGTGGKWTVDGGSRYKKAMLK